MCQVERKTEVNMTHAVAEQNMPLEHPDRASWYEVLIYEWTRQFPLFAVVDGMVAAWVMGYSSQAGVVHVTPTQVWSVSVEQALEDLALSVYNDLQADLNSLVKQVSRSLSPQGRHVCSA